MGEEEIGENEGGKGRWQTEERGVGNPRGGVGEDGAERPRKGPKRETWETEKGCERRHQEGSRILRQKEGKRDRDQEVGRQGKCGRTGERGRRWEMSQGPLAGRAGRGGDRLGRRPVTCGPSPHC